MKLTIANRTIANSDTDGVTRYMRVNRPELSIKTASVEIVGKRYARNVANSWGIAFAFSVIVGRTFKSYENAEDFTMKHISEFAEGASGELHYKGSLGCLYGFENAVLENIKINSEIGISCETEYLFRCGKPINEFDFVISVDGNLLSVDSKYVSIRV